MNNNYSVGKINRINNIINKNTKKTVIIPLDHSVTYGPIDGLNNLTSLIQQVSMGGANAIIGHKNIFYNIESITETTISRILHLSAATTLNFNKEDKILISSVSDAIKLGATGVSIQIDINSNTSNNFLKTLGSISSECYDWGMPLIIMAYYSQNNKDEIQYSTNIEHLVRLCSDIGADIVKIQYPSSSKIFHNIIEKCEIPVIIAGGKKVELEKELLNIIFESINNGGSGVAIGRNIFQSKNPKILTEKIVKIIHHNYTIKEIEYQYDK